MNYNEIMREIYLRSTPSVDLRTATEQVDCCKHRLSVSEYERILEDFKVRPNTDEYATCNMMMLMSGPQLYENQ